MALSLLLARVCLPLARKAGVCCWPCGTVAILLEWMPVPELLLATHRLLQPLRHCGVDPDRGVVRLLLVMRHIETLPRPRDWRILLQAPANDGDEVLELAERRFSWLDPLLMLLVVGLVAVFCLRQV
jgi:hypothetical protein